MVKIVKSNLLPPQFNRQFQPQFQRGQRKKKKKKKRYHNMMPHIAAIHQQRGQAKHSTGLSFGRPCADRRIRHYVEESEPRAGRAQSMQPYLTQFKLSQVHRALTVLRQHGANTNHVHSCSHQPLWVPAITHT